MAKFTTHKPSVVEGLIAKLGHEHPEVRFEAACKLADLGDRRAIDGLIAALADTSGVLLRRENACKPLAALAAKHRDQRAVKALAAAVDDADREVRTSAVYALGSLGDAAALEPLVAGLRHGDPRIRSASAYMIGTLGAARAVGPLIAALDDGDLNAQEQKIKTLGILGNKRAVEPLITFLKTCPVGGLEYTRVRGAALIALGQIGGDRAVEALEGKIPEVLVGGDDWSYAQAALNRL